jgi:hypothetical protein
MKPAHPAGGEVHYPNTHMLVLESQMRRDRTVSCLVSHEFLSPPRAETLQPIYLATYAALSRSGSTGKCGGSRSVGLSPGALELRRRGVLFHPLVDRRNLTRAKIRIFHDLLLRARGRDSSTGRLVHRREVREFLGVRGVSKVGHQ